ncbi:uncharacterized protein LAJ45_08450 [Morchella importuna]|uniref:uncharacterized protein n=1 Tax=Morchella importuna TaxID=1174673 RepID=UPI001E8DF072|nr:uncharacterized protein LAJ45_08450 [Morchella importuna]KAH8147622.1 hypothetical protein LAJ45_08450 [Morchella importuna]
MLLLYRTPRLFPRSFDLTWSTISRSHNTEPPPAASISPHAQAAIYAYSRGIYPGYIVCVYSWIDVRSGGGEAGIAGKERIADPPIRPPRKNTRRITYGHSRKRTTTSSTHTAADRLDYTQRLVGRRWVTSKAMRPYFDLASAYTVVLPHIMQSRSSTALPLMLLQCYPGWDFGKCARQNKRFF